MNAGRELDALIAENVMGWKRDPESYSGQCYIDDRGHFRLPEELPHYSIDIAVAWRVIEHMQRRYDCLISVSVLPSVLAHRGAFSCVITGGDLDYPTSALTISAYAHTAPLAICFAALKAMHSQDAPVTPQDGPGEAIGA